MRSERDNNENNHSKIFGGGQAQSSSERAQSLRGQSSSRGQISSRSTIGEIESSYPYMAIQMFSNKSKKIVQNNPLVIEEQKKKVEDPLESNRRFNQMNEEIKNSYDEREAILRQREKKMHEVMLEVKLNT